MKYVNFNYVIAKNFLSIGNEPVKIEFKNGINIITGINKDKTDRRNGIGKSTIADSIHFAIFGETIREIPKNNIINNINKKDTYVEMGFSILENNNITNYKIIRTLKPTRCYLFINDEDKTESTIPNTTSRIKEILNTSPEVFQNCVIMSLNTTLPFMAQKKVEKRKFIEGILKLEIFSQMLQVARSQYTDCMRDYDTSTKELSYHDNYKNITSKLLNEKTNNKNNKIEQLQQDIKKRENKILELKKKIIEPDKNIIVNIKNTSLLIGKKISDIESSLSSLLRKKMSYEAEIKLFTNMYKSIGTDKSVCPVCLHTITNDDIEHINIEKNKILQNIKDRNSDIKDIDIQVSNLENRKSEYITENNKCKDFLRNCITIIESNKRVKSSIKDIKEEIEEIKVQLSYVGDEDESIIKLQKDLENYKNKVDNLSIEVNNLSHKNKILEYVKFILSEEGVKSFIVKKILNILNTRLLFYLKKMDANCVCVFNEYFEEVINNDKGEECSYFNFSGAERKNIDLACLFTFMDIRRLQGDVSYNLVMFDELLDSSLDEKGVELVLNILKDRVDQYNESIYIISHRKESVKESSGEVVYLEKNNGVTRRIQYSN